MWLALHPARLEAAAGLITNPTALVVGCAAAAVPLRTGLEAAGCHVREAVTFADALALLDESGPGPDIIVLCLDDDWKRHVADCGRLAHQFAAAPLIVVAGDLDPDVEPALLAAGATDFLLRPFGIREVIARVRVALRLRSERQRVAMRELRLVTETMRLERKSEDLSKLVSVDPLTGLINRRHALTLLAAEWRRAARAGTSIGVVVVDLDYFHRYNEDHGHLGGDTCLRQVAAAMAGCLRRPTDFLARFGGEEFLAVLAATDCRGMQLVSERLRAAVEALGIPHVTPSGGTVVTISAGFAACVPGEGEADANRLLAEADAALFQAKARGRNRVAGDASAAVAASTRQSPAGSVFPVVTVDPSLVDRVPAFLAEVWAEIRVLTDALGRSNLDQIRVLGHRLQATAGDAGFEEIAAFGARLDRSAGESDVARIKETIEELASYVERVQVVYRRTNSS